LTLLAGFANIATVFNQMV